MCYRAREPILFIFIFIFLWSHVLAGPRCSADMTTFAKTVLQPPPPHKFDSDFRMTILYDPAVSTLQCLPTDCYYFSIAALNMNKTWHGCAYRTTTCKQSVSQSSHKPSLSHTHQCGLTVQTLPFITAGKSKRLSLGPCVIYAACAAVLCFHNPIKAYHEEQVLEK